MFHREIAYPEHPRNRFIRWVTRYMIWAIIEQEATEFLGKAHYKQGEIRLSKTRKQLTLEGSFWRMEKAKEKQTNFFPDYVPITNGFSIHYLPSFLQYSYYMMLAFPYRMC